LNCVSACNQSQIVPELKDLCFYEAMMRGLYIIKNGSSPKDWSNYNKRIFELAKGNPSPVTLNDINECGNKLSCSIDVYDKHGLLVGRWGTAVRLVSLYLNDNHYDLITDINKFKAYTSRQMVIKHCR
jgi:hypothetical protein